MFTEQALETLKLLESCPDCEHPRTHHFKASSVRGVVSGWGMSGCRHPVTSGRFAVQGDDNPHACSCDMTFPESKIIERQQLSAKGFFLRSI